ncbi:MAG: hypothetical protein KF708_02305 [Pirellulales bacterium]|nr:hypothetical protein [Pirellulales bacterium]
MNWQAPHDDPLDDLLRAARWSEADAQQTSHLAERWRKIHRRQRIVDGARVAGMALAAVVLVGGSLTWQMMTVESPLPALVEVAPESPAAPLNLPGPLPAPEENAVAPVPLAVSVASREANPFELAIVRRQQQARAKERRPFEQDAPTEPVAPTEQARDDLESVIARLLANGAEDLPAAAVVLDETHVDAESRLRALVEQSRGAKQAVALRLLATLATRDSLLFLINHSLRPHCPDEVLAAIERLCETHELAELAYRAESAERRRAWLAALLRRDAAENTPAYLALLRHPSITQDAIAALVAAENPPIEGLFAALASPDVDERIVAARALAARNDPAVSRRLAQIVMQNNARREALVALLMSKDAVASEFLAYARTDLRLWPSVQAVSAQYASVLRLN